MISDFFSYKNSLDDIYQFQVLSNGSTSGYWYLNPKETVSYSTEDNIFGPEEIRAIIFISKKLKKQYGTVGSDEKEIIIKKIRTSSICWMPMNCNTDWIYRRLTDYVINHNKTYFDFDLTKIESLQFTEYRGEETGHYSKHVDPMFWNIPEDRKLSFVVQLSDPSTYEGGDLLLYSGISSEPIKIEKKIGKIVFFPSNVLHEVTPVTKGTRHTLVGWVHGPKLR